MKASGNTLYPIFLKHHQIRYLVIGAGTVAYEKLISILTQSPQSHIVIVATQVAEKKNLQLVAQYPNITLIEKRYEVADLQNIHLVIAAINDMTTIQQIRRDTQQKQILLNACDKPKYCDFYLSSIVSKGNLKIAISTNGKSPTMAKRIKETLQEVFPDNIDDVLNQLNDIRNYLKLSLEDKIKTLNNITKAWRNSKKYKNHEQNRTS